MGMTVKEVAATLNGNEYGKVGSRALFGEMKAAGLVAVFGHSDDLVELRGAVTDEVGAFNGTVIYMTSSGLLQNECDSDRCPHFEWAKKSAAKITAIWAPESSTLSWAFRTAIPHETFTIMEDGEPYCEGIVFALADVP